VVVFYCGKDAGFFFSMAFFIGSEALFLLLCGLVICFVVFYFLFVFLLFVFFGLSSSFVHAVFDWFLSVLLVPYRLFLREFAGLFRFCFYFFFFLCSCLFDFVMVRSGVAWGDCKLSEGYLVWVAGSGYSVFLFVVFLFG